MWRWFPKDSRDIFIFDYKYTIEYYKTVRIFIWTITDSFVVLFIISLWLTTYFDKIRGLSVKAILRSPFNLQIFGLLVLFANYAYELYTKIPQTNEANFWTEISVILFSLVIMIYIIYKVSGILEFNYYHKLKAVIATIIGLQSIKPSREKTEMDDMMEDELRKLKEISDNIYS